MEPSFAFATYPPHLLLIGRADRRCCQMTSVAESHRWLTVRETAERLRVSEETIRRSIARGKLPAVQLAGKGSTIRIAEHELEGWLLGEREAER